MSSYPPVQLTLFAARSRSIILKTYLSLSDNLPHLPSTTFNRSALYVRHTSRTYPRIHQYHWLCGDYITSFTYLFTYVRTMHTFIPLAIIRSIEQRSRDSAPDKQTNCNDHYQPKRNKLYVSANINCHPTGKCSHFKIICTLAKQPNRPLKKYLISKICFMQSEEKTFVIIIIIISLHIFIQDSGKGINDLTIEPNIYFNICLNTSSV